MSKVNLIIVSLFYGFDCNLTCRDCSSGYDILRNKNHDPSEESLLKSIEDMSHYVNDITDMFTLIGGEPFLYWDRIELLVRHFRKFYPTTKINITTNGVLLHKFKDRVIDLMMEVDHIRISLTNHFSEFMDDPTGIKYKQNLDYFFSDPRINCIHDLHYDIPNHDINFHFHDFSDGFTAQWRREGSKLKPWATNDPKASMDNGCIGRVCSALHNSKLYKCMRFVTLPTVLDKVGQLTDPEWSKYLNYQPIDLSLDDVDGLVDKFVNNQGNPISECDMCHNKKIVNITQIPHTKENIFTKPYV
jgi:organic radical activating enzyme